LEFKDSHGKTVKCDEKVGASSWPKVLKFPNCSRLEFIFRSDSRLVDWGYKFKVYVLFLCLFCGYFGKFVVMQEKFVWYIELRSVYICNC